MTGGGKGDSAIPKGSERTPTKRAKFTRPHKPQEFENGEIHRWYNFVLGFSDKLVKEMFDRLDVAKGQLVFDPFCGTGTTLVESRKRGINSVGIDASPFSCFVSRVKTSALLEPEKLLTALVRVGAEYHHQLERESAYISNRTYRYLRDSGMLERGWISNDPLRKALALKEAIIKAAPSASYRDALLLALVSKLPSQIGNMKYGPEIYCGRKRRKVDVWGIFESSTAEMLQDLWKADGKNLGIARVFQGDARKCSTVLRQHGIRRVHTAISSPPYPTEHDYTRNTRLELAFLDYIESNDCLRLIKKEMIRSHTKGVYKTDLDGEEIANCELITKLADRVAGESRKRKYGFARLYPTVIRQYFGGMKRHFKSMASIMAPEGKYAIVVGDQASYFGIHIPTAKLLGHLAEESGFAVEDSIVWRRRWATTTSKSMKEHALILRRRAK